MPAIDEVENIHRSHSFISHDFSAPFSHKHKFKGSGEVSFQTEKVGNYVGPGWGINLALRVGN